MIRYQDNPPMLPSEWAQLPSGASNWWVAHTKSRSEKSFAWELASAGIGYFLPMYEQVRVSGGRKRRVLKPLFPSYVFFCGDHEDRYAALATGRLCQVIEVPDSQQLVGELNGILQALRADPEIHPYPKPATGEHCRVTAGPLQGLEGTVIREAQQHRFVLSVSMLGQGAEVEIELDLLEVVEAVGAASSIA